ncbi:MAG: integrating conjugative element protein [Hydrogenovibrio crunogenus]|nr:integrating conjugative element protein [Hydrogenovibrio crunogenus]
MKKLIFILLYFGVVSAAFSAPPTWGVLGPTVPFVSPLGQNINKPVKPKIIPLSYAQMVNKNLPIKSRLSPGKFNRFRSEPASRVTQPICLVGYDDLSLSWLEKNRDALSRYKTVCFVMQAKNLTQIKRIKQIAGGKILFQPVSGQQIASDFKVPAYPALIYDGWVIQ